VFNNSLLSPDQSKRLQERIAQAVERQKGRLGERVKHSLDEPRSELRRASPAVNNESFMNDNSDYSFTDRYSTKRASQAWEEASSPIVRFRTDDGACWGFIFHHLEYACFERDTLLLEWSIGTIRIRGPKAEMFFDKFANHQATSISSDGKDIESITMRLKSDDAVEEAFAAIEKLTDADLNIDDESDERG
jgi:hypothetical protein